MSVTYGTDELNVTRLVQVYSAPHIQKMSSILGTRFSPILYKLDGDSIISNVRYSSSLFKEGWLSASGRIQASSEDTLQIIFDQFWIDFGSNSLRQNLPGANLA